MYGKVNTQLKLMFIFKRLTKSLTSPPNLFPIQSQIRSMATLKMPRDPNTLSNYHNWVTKHTTADFIIDFAAQKLSGNVTLHLQSLTASESSEIILDTSFVDIKAISLDGTKIKDWEVKDRSEPYGSPLHIQIAGGRKLDEIVKINVELETTDKCTALQWLTKEQAGGKQYMFSQCQAIHARSLFPCQDTPDVKSTFDFLIHSPLPVIASGLPVEPAVAKSSNKTSAEGKLYQFEQKIPMTSYLFALASGDIVTAEIGPRSVVAAGPEFLKDSKWELEKVLDFPLFNTPPPNSSCKFLC
jgi:leukotriene-A4 hydrolase